jgi:hypothetical protein
LKNYLRFLRQTHLTFFKRHSWPSRSSSRPSPKSCQYRNSPTSCQYRRNLVSRRPNWSYSSHPAGFWLAEIWLKRPDSGRLAEFVQKGWIWLEYPGWISSEQIWLENPGQNGWIPAYWPDSNSSGRIPAGRPESGDSVPNFWPLSKILAIVAEIR